MAEPFEANDCESGGCSGLQMQVSRRGFLFGSGAAVVSLVLPGVAGARVMAQRADYPRRKIGTLGELDAGKPVEFHYPWEHANARNWLIRLQERAAGGVGPDENVVAFNGLCTHQGGSMAGTFRGDVGVAGPCPLHWTTFDLTRHGIVVSGHSTQGLPQILLETEEDDVYAVGVLGLIFGYHDNHVDPTALKRDRE